MTIFLAIFVAVCILGEFWKGARTRMRTAGENFALALYNLTMRNTRRYGGYLVHLGIVLLFIGFAGLAFKTEAKGLMQEGDLLRVKNYLLRCDGLVSGETPNYEYTRASSPSPKRPRFHLLASREALLQGQPAAHQLCVHPPHLRRGPLRRARRSRPGSGKAAIEVFINPLVSWVWFGGLVVFFGTLLALVPSRVEREMAEVRRAQEVATQANDAL